MRALVKALVVALSRLMDTDVSWRPDARRLDRW